MEIMPCPFCGGSIIIGIVDDEGNPHDETYAKNPYSGIGYTLVHDDSVTMGDCPITTWEGEFLGFIYDSADEAIVAWNTRK